MTYKFLLPLISFATVSSAAFAQVSDSTQRRIKLQGAVNFRDLGGYATSDGKKVKWGKIYRAAELSNLTANDLSSLERLSIHYIMDFRGPSEVASAPDKLPANAIRVSLPYGSENTGDRAKTMQLMSSSENGDSIMMPFYANISSFTQRYKPVFEALLTNAKDSALLFHCTAGKDRTGIAAALVLSALGVDENTIMQDYLASNYYRRPDNERMKTMLINTYHIKENVVEDVVGVKENYLQATFTAITKQYGSMNKYLEKEMGLDNKTSKILKQKYLE